MPSSIAETPYDIARWQREGRNLWRRFAVIPPLVQSVGDMTLAEGDMTLAEGNMTLAAGDMSWVEFIIPDREHHLIFADLIQYYLAPAMESLAHEVDKFILQQIYATLSGTNQAPFLPQVRENTQDSLLTAQTILNNHEAPRSGRSLVKGYHSEAEFLLASPPGDAERHWFNTITSPHVDDLSQGLSLAWGYNAIKFTSNLHISMRYIVQTGVRVRVEARGITSILNPMWIILFQDRNDIDRRLQITDDERDILNLSPSAS